MTIPPSVPGTPEFNEELLRDARQAFPQFYAKASREDQYAMDSLVLGHAALTVLINAPRQRIADEVRRHLERLSDSVDQLFAANREYIRACPTFRSIDARERGRIEKVLFEVQVSFS